MTRIPPRIHLPFREWPDIDQSAWANLFRDGDILDGRGAASHWAPATRKTNQKHYSRWLGWLEQSCALDIDTQPAARATPERIEAYARSLIEPVAPRTVASALIGLKCVLKTMRPDLNWRWLMDLTNRLDSWALPSRDRSDRMLPAKLIFQGVLEEFERLSATSLELRRDQLKFRDTLIIGLLTACPVRMRNLVSIRINKHLQKVDTDWWLSFQAEETKTYQAVSYVIPTLLVPWLELYLTKVRPSFRMAPGSMAIWPGCKGNPLAPESIYMRVMITTERLFGVAIDPHSFRSIAATFLAEQSPKDALHARPLLGHRYPATTERYYIKANQIAASRKVTEALQRIRDK